MSKNKYSDEFKLMVIKEYLDGDLGVRLLSKKYNLPSKNYITNWHKYLIDKKLIDPNLKFKPKKGSIKKNINTSKTSYEKLLEQENLRLRAELAFLSEYKRLTDIEGKKKHT